MKKLFTVFFIFLSALAFARKSENLNLALSFDDVLVEAETQENFVKGNGFHIFIKKVGDIQSVMLLSPADGDNFFSVEILRATEFNPINGGEVRKYKGKKADFGVLKTSFSLMASKTEKHETLGECFHIYVPQKVIYGYKNSAPVEFKKTDFQKLIIRTYEKKGCDYSGTYEDYLFAENTKARKTFTEISEAGSGKFIRITKASELPPVLETEISELNPEEKIDLVFVIDATDSMKDDIAELRKNWLSNFEKQMKNFKDIRLGLLFYKDYGDEFKTKGMPVKFFDFTKSVSTFSKNLKNVSVRGGGDIPEAVYEALYFASTNFNWSNEAKKKIILIGDAEPHENDEKYNITFETVSQSIKEKGICADCILVADTLGKISTSESEKTKTSEKVEKVEVSGDAK